MFYSPIIRGVLAALIVASGSVGYAETVAVSAGKAAVLREIGQVAPVRLPIMVRAPIVNRKELTPVVPQKARQVLVVEPPRRLSLDRLRRESSRYPELDMVGRFVELSTECPPLFGDE